MLAACYNVPIDTMQKWCEHVYLDVDLTEKYAPAWAILPSVSFEYDSVRTHYVSLLNQQMLEVVQHRADRMAWRDSTDLHIESLATLMEVHPDSIIGGWKDGLQRVRNGNAEDPADACFFGTAASLFDRVHIHTGIWDSARLQLLQDSVTILATGRTQTF